MWVDPILSIDPADIHMVAAVEIRPDNCPDPGMYEFLFETFLIFYEDILNS